MAGERRGKPGRQSFGERHAFSVRWSAEDRSFIADEARKLGIADASYIIKVFNEATGRPIPWWVEEEVRRASARSDKEELDMPQSA
jgi:hypothetical protein